MIGKWGKLAFAALLFGGGQAVCAAGADHAAPAEAEARNLVEVPGVPYLSQFPELPTGCEATAVAMLLQWEDLDVSKEEVASIIPREPMPGLEEGEDGEEAALMTGGNPNEAFIGDPESVGFGVYHKPVADAIDHYLPGQAKDLTGISFEGLLHVVENGSPVVVWATVDMAEPELYAEWTDRAGHTVAWYEPEHAMTLVGYDDERVYVHDPYSGGEGVYERELFRDRWEKMGSQAVAIARKSGSGEAESARGSIELSDGRRRRERPWFC